MVPRAGRAPRMMRTVRGIKNPTTACHVTSSLALLCHCLAPVREAILLAGRKNAIAGGDRADTDPICRELARFLEEYYVTGDDACDQSIMQIVEVPVKLYRALLQETGIQAENVGDGVTTLAKILDHLRRCADPPEIARIANAALDGSCHRVVQDGRRRKILPQRSMPCPFPLRIEGDSTTLVESLQRALQPQLVVRKRAKTIRRRLCWLIKHHTFGSFIWTAVRISEDMTEAYQLSTLLCHSMLLRSE
jgi:hypothetical protein